MLTVSKTFFKFFIKLVKINCFEIGKAFILILDKIVTFEWLLQTHFWSKISKTCLFDINCLNSEVSWFQQFTRFKYSLMYSVCSFSTCSFFKQTSKQPVLGQYQLLWGVVVGITIQCAYINIIMNIYKIHQLIAISILMFTILFNILMWHTRSISNI